MIGSQNTTVKVTFGPLLNGFVNHEYWVPAPSMRFAGVDALLQTYRARSAAADVDALGHYMAPLAYAQMQVVAQAVEAIGPLDDERLSAHARHATFQTIMGPVRFGARGEWLEPRVLQVPFQGIADNGIAQFADGSRQVVLSPPDFAGGRLLYPFA